MPGSQTISWTAPSNADSNTRYNVYIDDEQNGWNGSCSSPLSGDSCVQNLNATSTNFTFTSAHQYHIWVTAISCSFPASAQVDSFVGVPAPIPTVAIQGNLREYDTPACHNDISTNGLSINISAQYPSGVTPVCTVNPSSGTTKSSYNCNVSFDEFANPTPVATQNLTVSATSTEYQPGYLVDSAACEASGSSSIAIDLAAPTPTTTFTKDLLFKIAKSWIKIKNGSFASSLNVSNPIPLSVTSYDLEDDGSRLFIMASAGNDPGAATARALNIGTADPSSKGWKADYQKLGVLNPATFLEYVKARKEFKEIDNLSELETGKIHVWTGGDLTIEDASKFDNIKGVLISTGTVNITKDFKPSSASVAIIANSITFAGDPEPVEEAEGLFVAETINTGETAAQGLKITGNLVAASGLTNNRTWGSNSRPGIFIIFNPTLYMELLPYVSVSKYEYQQTQ
ncbi:hypothetical protein A3G67_00645 [Candidatus Roizmanbacteria bacterium RIFCSPLOWO2_12_FULL_40_12]|uniref:Fibronectin type-III domain-containing protein n=1 Tax=Candidatus Roizmanbacteria bacterium RIFCSPLOWO2_01_FULL_40_42 TaxID=1802066 RepID=A0A1F7J6B6_9BACT|nr:MAG: hypothetical protein A2779_02125 [Candidatus Roizmanbacteria bacterium RIFCSPHIGHO2_01_FULL_40_98]OGK28787.1 MAG: hypothetical protein A3C31_04045 [Candidatus Roizmanbacteria bacterium RIFCSPHIGHO2_02_FULL_40_53]OGK29645.1 MAG: hypothetical protein A2W49_00440 [Candidatus Roizmanbacteria bacterium RIFCSPHIGHO2_12_41_18]OGK36320.1 MAG: hypothetical protein A3E69_02740 [Candidatus Roizmanbacteria bacterium RIFCSPHIGHO2_12_FULL_40_130]OGK51128.1 MAG: hypothetical protein A3B50_05020 [Candi